MTLFNTNRTLFYALMAQHIEEFMPIVYDPVVADAIRQYDELFMKPQDAAVNKITSFSQHLAEVVAQYAIDHQNTRENITDARAAVERIKWYPSYE